MQEGIILDVVDGLSSEITILGYSVVALSPDIEYNLSYFATRPYFPTTVALIENTLLQNFRKALQ